MTRAGKRCTTENTRYLGIGIDGHEDPHTDYVIIQPEVIRYDAYNTQDQSDFGEQLDPDPNYGTSQGGGPFDGGYDSTYTTYLNGETSMNSQDEGGGQRRYNKTDTAYSIRFTVEVSDGFGTAYGGGFQTVGEDGVESDYNLGLHNRNKKQYTFYYTIPAKDIQLDTFEPQSQGDIVYCPMGGTYSGATQIKVKNTNLTLNSEIPARKSFTFNGWNTALDGSGTSYSPGDSYTQNEPLMLFAQGTKKISSDSLRYVLGPYFKNFIASIKSRLKPDNLSAYIIKEGIFKTVHENATATGTNVDGGGQYRHGNDGIAEAGGCGLGQTSTGDTVTSLYTRLPKNIFVDHPIVTMSLQSNDRDGIGPTYVNPHTIMSDENPSDSNDIGFTYIDARINHDGGNAGKGKNYGVKYYVRGRWAYKATITSNSAVGFDEYTYVEYNNKKYITANESFIFKPGETLNLRAFVPITSQNGTITVDGTVISGNSGTLPFKDISIEIHGGSNNAQIIITTL